MLTAGRLPEVLFSPQLEELSKFIFLSRLLFVVATTNQVDQEMWISSIFIKAKWLNVCFCFQAEPTFQLVW